MIERADNVIIRFQQPLDDNAAWATFLYFLREARTSSRFVFVMNSRRAPLLPAHQFDTLLHSALSRAFDFSIGSQMQAGKEMSAVKL